MRDRLYRVQAVIIKRTDVGEADRLLTLFTAERGKLRVVAKGARKPSSRKSGHVELFNRVSLLVAKGRNLDILTQVDTLEAYMPLRENLDRLGYAYYLGELVDRFTEEDSEHPALFDLVVNALGWLGETDDAARTMRYIELQLLNHVGYRPQLFRCVHCGDMIEPVDNFFTVEGGGLLDPKDSLAFRDAQPISLNALKVLRWMQSHEYASLRELKIGDAVRDELEALLQKFITVHLERNLKSVGFLRELRQPYGTPPPARN